MNILAGIALGKASRGDFNMLFFLVLDIGVLGKQILLQRA